MSRLKKEDAKKVVKVTFTIEPEILKKLREYAELENLPLSRSISRIIKRYLEMR